MFQIFFLSEKLWLNGNKIIGQKQSPSHSVLGENSVEVIKHVLVSFYFMTSIINVVKNFTSALPHLFFDYKKICQAI